MKRVALVADVRDWAFDINLKALEKYVLSDKSQWSVDFFYAAECPPRHVPAHNARHALLQQWENLKNYDVVFTPYHRWGHIDQYLPWDRTLGSLRSLWFKPERPAPPCPQDIARVNQYARFHVVTKQNLEELKPTCPNVCYLTNPVDTELFSTEPEITDYVVAEWNGRADHSNGIDHDIKGLHSILKPACEAVNVPLSIAEYTHGRIQNRDMPNFYKHANLALCGSLYEGASNSVMEAMASGLALLTTDCGNAREMQESQRQCFGDTGIEIVERTIPAFCNALSRLQRDPKRVLEMGLLNKKEIEARWAWRAWAPGYKQFIEGVPNAD